MSLDDDDDDVNLKETHPRWQALSTEMLSNLPKASWLISGETGL